MTSLSSFAIRTTPSVLRTAVAVIAMLTTLLFAAAAAHAEEGPAWSTPYVFSTPTNLAPSGAGFADADAFIISAANVGGAATSGTVTLTFTLPEGLSFANRYLGAVGGDGGFTQYVLGSCEEIAPRTIACRFIQTVRPGDFIFVEAFVVPDAGLAEGTELPASQVTISGGGAPEAQAATTVDVSSSNAPFDFLQGTNGLGISLTGADGLADTKAGSHPGSFATNQLFSVATGTLENPRVRGSEGGLHGVHVDLPAGVVINPNATPVRCTEAQLEMKECPDASQIGLADIQIVVNEDLLLDQENIYNLVPPPGSASNFAFDAGGFKLFQHVLGTVRPGNVGAGGYALSAGTNDILQLWTFPLFGVRIQLWGDPSSPVHDYDRGLCHTNHPGSTGGCPVEPQTAPMVTNPTACPSSLPFRADADSWEHLGDLRHAGSAVTDSADVPTGVDGCGSLQFAPTLEARPTTDAADSPSGLSVDLHIPQAEGMNEPATAHLRKAVVTLPEGLTLNPASANGLEGCSSAQIGIDPSTGVPDGNQPSCPDGSRVGEVEVDTPLLPNALHGSVYVAAPYDNPFASLLAIYIAVNDPQTGTLIKLAGHVETDPSTGRLTTTFDENPQLPFSDFKLDFFRGPGAVLRTPAVCGTYSTTSSLTPWSAPESGPPATPSDSYPIAGGCSQSEGSEPNKPEFSAGALSPIAGKYTPFVVHLKREDGSQQFSKLTLTPPPGLTAKLAGTPECSDGALAAAAGKSGRDEQANPSCPGDSKIGTVRVGAGAGPAPYYASGTAYLSGPYKGAPLSMAIITPAVAGPFDLGTVVTRVALHVNPATAQITADADPVPSILEGIPLDVRSIDVALDKPDFSRTGTSCDPFSVSGQLISTLGQGASLESHYQLGNCANLPFKPHLGIRLKGATTRGENPKLIATLGAKDGEANIASTAVRLPRSAFLDQSHIRTVCTRVQFAAGAGNGEQCPAGSIYGQAWARSPLLDYTLTGNAYLRSSSHKLPDLVLALHGPPSQPIAIEVDGRTDSVKGALRNTFEAVPDAPVSFFRLMLFGGKRGLVVNSRNLCAHDYRANVAFGAQNGAQLARQPKVEAQCVKAHKKKHTHRHRRNRRGTGHGRRR